MTAHRDDKFNACHYGATGTYKAAYDHQHLNIGYYSSSEQLQTDIKPLLLLEEYEQLCKEFGLCDDSQPLTHPQSHRVRLF